MMVPGSKGESEKRLGGDEINACKMKKNEITEITDNSPSMYSIAMNQQSPLPCQIIRVTRWIHDLGEETHTGQRFVKNKYMAT